MRATIRHLSLSALLCATVHSEALQVERKECKKQCDQPHMHCQVNKDGLGDPYSCVCDYGYAFGEGADSGKCLPLLCLGKCTGKYQFCDENKSEYWCNCGPGFKWSDSSKTTCVKNEVCKNKCGGGHQICIADSSLDAGYKCQCWSGYVPSRTGTGCERDPRCVGRCTAGQMVCVVDEAQKDGYQCKCWTGYRWKDDSKTRCIGDNCHKKCQGAHMKCMANENLANGHKCSCKNGYRMNAGETACVENKPVNLCAGKCTGAGETCVVDPTVMAGYECACAKGHEMVDSVCVKSFVNGRCYKDMPRRAMTLARNNMRGNDRINQCRRKCASRRYKFAGIEIGRECFCSNGGFDQYGELDRSKCNSKCSVKNGCGGTWALTVYTAVMSCPAGTELDINRGKCVTPFREGRCYRDKFIFRAMKTATLKLTGYNKIAQCRDLCATKEYEYAGVEWGVQCFCSNGNYAKYGELDRSKCSSKCTTDLGCGGLWALTVYSAKLDRRARVKNGNIIGKIIGGVVAAGVGGAVIAGGAVAGVAIANKNKGGRHGGHHGGHRGRYHGGHGWGYRRPVNRGWNRQRGWGHHG